MTRSSFTTSQVFCVKTPFGVCISRLPSFRSLVNGAFPLTINPRLRLTKVKASTHFAENDDWWNSPLAVELESIFNRIGAFKLPAGLRDAAILVHLPPGGYTIVVENMNSDVGVALLEVYEVPTP